MKYMSMMDIKYNFIYSTVLFLDFKFKNHHITINIFRNLFRHYQLSQDYLILVNNSLN